MTPQPDLRKRPMPSVKASTSEPTVLPETPALPANLNPRTTTYASLPSWQRDNSYIRTHYRISTSSYSDTLLSLTYLHSETCNVYNHALGALLLPFIAAFSIHGLASLGVASISHTDYVMFGLFFVCAECCLVFSALYHLFSSHSEAVERFWLGMDLLGIVVVVEGTFVSGIYYLFACESDIRNVHWTIIILSGSATAVLSFMPDVGKWRAGRMAAFVALGASAFIPLLHGVHRYGLDYMLAFSGMKWYLLELLLYGCGVGLYGTRTPERFAPGRFDVWGSSHQIFHVAILGGMFVHAVALVDAATACHMLDLCAIQEAIRGS